MPINVKFLNGEDLPSVAKLHSLNFPESLLTALGPECVRRYYEWQLYGPHQVIALGAFRRSELKGFCFGGIFQGAMTGFLQKNRGYLSWTLLTRPHIMLNAEFRSRLVFGVRLIKNFSKRQSPSSHSKSYKTKSFGILSIAVDPAIHGSGVGTLLMHKSECIARNNGFKEMGLTVHPDNFKAISFYEKLSWQKKFTENGTFEGRMIKVL